MCYVSVILEQGIKQPEYYWTQEKLYKFKELIEAARKFDREAGEPDCELEEKIEWLKALESKMKATRSTNSSQLTEINSP